MSKLILILQNDHTLIENKSEASTTQGGVIMQINEESLQQMESILSQAALGTHILFDNCQLRKVLSVPKVDTEFFDFETMEKVQDLLSQLMAKTLYHDKLAFLDSLEPELYEIVVRSYFHLVEHQAYSSHHLQH